MKFFIDTADVGEIREAAALGVLDGVDTSTGLAEVADLGRVLREIVSIVNGPILVRPKAADRDASLERGRELAAVHPNVVVTLPLNREELEACKTLASEGIRVNVGPCLSEAQALMAAKAGAAFVNPTAGELVRRIRAIYDNYGFETEVLAGSIADPHDCVEAALAGADASTLSLEVVRRLLEYPRAVFDEVE